MCNKHPKRQKVLDPRFFHLVRWELRHLRGRRQGTWGLTLGLVGGGIVIAAWWAASQPEPGADTLAILHTVAVGLLATPLRDSVASLAQITFGYTLLRFMAYALIAFSKVTLPAIAAGTIADDRRTRRMEELQTALFTAPQIYLAKALAAALPFLMMGGMLLLLLAGVVIGEYVPAREVARLALELIGQVLLAAFVTVTCSARFASRWTAMVAAYVLLWLVLPAGWVILLSRMDETLPNLFFQATHGLQRLGFSGQCAVQAVLTGAGCLVAILIGVGKLHPHGWKGMVLGPFRKGR
jgi:hypothetical protein